MGDDHFRARVVLISAQEPGSTPVGMGVLLSDTLVLTCAHVVAEALACNCADAERPMSGVQVSLAFPVRADNAKTALASVIENGWFPKQGSRNRSKPTDIALLEITPGQLTTAVVPPLALSTAISPSGAPAKLFGMTPESELVPIHGTVGDANGDGFYSLEQSGPGYRIEPGCSGAPVRGVSHSALLGIVVQDEIDRSLGIAFLIPSSDIRTALHLAGVSPPGSNGSELSLVARWADASCGAESRVAEKIKRFVALYSGSRTSPIPFVGRHDELVALRRAVDAGTGVCFIGGGAGMGKSALILHIAAAILRDRPTFTMLLLPISLRFGTSELVSGLAMLAAQFQAIFPALRTPASTSIDPDANAGIVAAGWVEVRNHHADHFVLLIDAVDEAIGDWIADRVLPMALPPNLQLIVSGRSAGPICDAPPWLHLNCGFDGRPVEVQVISLKPLPKDAVRAAVSHLGYTFHLAPGGERVLDELYRLSDFGDPLLVSFWVSILLDRHAPTASLSISSLRRMAPGISGYLDEWFKQQLLFCAASGQKFQRQQFEPLLHLVAVAEGAISAKDIDRLLRIDSPSRASDVALVEQALAYSWRILINTGDDTYTFVHPRIRYHYLDLLQETNALEPLRRGFVRDGRAEVKRVDQDAGDAPPIAQYVLQNYCSHIQAAADCYIGDELLDLVDELLKCPHWPRQSLKSHGTYGRYVSDLQRLDVLLANLQVPRAERLRLRNKLCRLSISSIGENIPPTVLIALLESKAWIAESVQRYIKAIYSDRKRYFALADMLPHVNTVQCSLLIDDLLVEAPAAATPQARVTALARLFDFEFNKHGTVLADAVACALAIPAPQSQANAIALIAKYLPRVDRERILERAIRAAAEIPDELPRASALAAIAGACEPNGHSLNLIASELYRFDDSVAVAQVLGSICRARVLPIALWQRLAALACARPDQRCAVASLLLLLPAAPDRHIALEQLLDYEAAILDSHLKADYLLELCQALPELRPIFVDVVRATLDSFAPDACLAMLRIKIAAFVSDKHPLLLKTAAMLTGLPGTDNFEWAVLKLVEAAAGMEDVQRSCVRLISRIQNVETLDATVARLAPDLLAPRSAAQLLASVRALPNPLRRSRALGAIARSVPAWRDPLLNKAIQEAAAIVYPGLRCSTLCVISRDLDEDHRLAVLAPAVECASAIGEPESRIRNLGRIAGHCGNLPELAERVFEAARTIDDQADACDALIRIAAARSIESRACEIERVLRFAQTVRNDEARTGLLSGVAMRLVEAPDQFIALLKDATRISSESGRGAVLVSMSMQLGRFPACAAIFLDAVRSLQDSHTLSLIYQQIFACFGDRRDVMQLALRNIDAIQDSRGKAMCLASLEGMLELFIRGVSCANNIFPDVALVADTMDLICGDTTKLPETIAALESYRDRNTDPAWIEEVGSIFAVIAWRISALPDTEVIVRRCLDVVVDDRIIPFAERAYQVEVAGSSRLRLTHPSFGIAGPRTDRLASTPKGASPYLTPGASLLPPQALLDVIQGAQTRAEAFASLALANMDVARDEEEDRALEECAEAIVAVSSWWP
jgi:hypothetical protein